VFARVLVSYPRVMLRNAWTELIGSRWILVRLLMHEVHIHTCLASLDYITLFSAILCNLQLRRKALRGYANALTYYALCEKS